MKIFYNKIVNTGMNLPPRVVKNDEISKFVDTSDEWIFTRTGIRERRISFENTSVMATYAVKDLLEKSNMDPTKIELIIFATVTPDNNTPSCACMIQKNIGAINAIAFDINAACTGFIYGLDIANSFIQSGRFKNALIIGADCLSKIINWKDRNTCILFGDGAGATFIERSSDNSGIVDIYNRSIGEKGDSLFSKSLPYPNLPEKEAVYEEGRFSIHMNGREILKFAVSAIVESIEYMLQKYNLSIHDLAYIIPHQANIRILKVAAEKLKISVDKFFINLHKYGNTSSASIPIALNELNEMNLLNKNDKIILVGFGGGLTYGSAYIIW